MIGHTVHRESGQTKEGLTGNQRPSLLGKEFKHELIMESPDFLS